MNGGRIGEGRCAGEDKCGQGREEQRAAHLAVAWACDAAAPARRTLRLCRRCGLDLAEREGADASATTVPPPVKPTAAEALRQMRVYPVMLK